MIAIVTGLAAAAVCSSNHRKRKTLCEVYYIISQQDCEAVHVCMFANQIHPKVIFRLYVLFKAISLRNVTTQQLDTMEIPLQLNFTVRWNVVFLRKSEVKSLHAI